MKRTYLTRAGVFAAAMALSTLGAPMALPAVAADNPGIDVVNTETVKIYLTADGKVDSKRVYEQLAITGKGPVELRNPVSTKGLRNLDGFGGFRVENGEQIISTEVDGRKHLRSVSDYDGEIPLDLSVTYLLNGQPIKPAALVGKSGPLEVKIHVKNRTTRTQTVQVDDGQGGKVDREVEVALPIVGSISTTVPSSYTNVASGQANLAGDGQGGTTLSFTMTLLYPVGSDEAEFSYTAEVKDATVPRIEVTALPVNPLDNPTFAAAGQSYQDGADTGARLTDGALEIDDNLLQLHDGAATLVEGILQLSDGAEQLSFGLNSQIRPGSQQLAAGAGELSAGLGKLDAGSSDLAAGAGTLNTGAKELSSGLGDAHAGSRDLTKGLNQISGGLGELAKQLPGASAGVDKLAEVAQQVDAGLGSPETGGTILYGLTELNNKLPALEAGLGRMVDGLDQLKQQVQGPLALMKSEIDDTLAQLGPVVAPGGSLDQLLGGLHALRTNSMNGNPLDCGPGCQQIADQLFTGAENNKDLLADGAGGLGALSAGLAQLSAGVGTGIAGTPQHPDPEFIPLLLGATSMQDGAHQAVKGVADLLAGATAAKAGTEALAKNLPTIGNGLEGAVDGVNKLDAGAEDAASGSKTLRGGLGQLSAGGQQLAAGTGDLSAGANELSAGAATAADGARTLAGGAGDLAEGLGTAGDGSAQLADGLNRARLSAPALPEGAQRLSDEGMSQLVAAGTETTTDYGAMVAALDAGAQRAKTEGMAIGAPDGAIGLTAYSYTILGEDGAGARKAKRGFGAVLVLGLAGGLLAWRRSAMAR